MRVLRVSIPQVGSGLTPSLYASPPRQRGRRRPAVQFAQEHRVHDLGDGLGGATDGLVHLHVEHDDVSVEAGVDKVHRVGDALDQRVSRRLLLQLPDKESRCRVVQHLTVGDDVAQVLGKGRLAGTEEARYPDAHALGRVARCVGDGLAQVASVLHRAR